MSHPYASTPQLFWRSKYLRAQWQDSNCERLFGALILTVKLIPQWYKPSWQKDTWWICPTELEWTWGTWYILIKSGAPPSIYNTFRFRWMTGGV